MPVMVPVLLDDLPPELKSRAEGATKVAQVREVVSHLREGDDDDATTIVLTFVLADPPAGMDTWPVEELWELRRIARDVVPQALGAAVAKAAADAGISVDAIPKFGWTVEFKPEHMPSFAADDKSIAF